MKKLITFLIIFCSILKQSNSQIQPIDFNAIENWKKLGEYGMSDNGKFIWYEVFSEKGGRQLFIVDSSGKELHPPFSADNIKFSKDSRFAFIQTADSVRQLNLYNGKINDIFKGTNLQEIIVNGSLYLLFTCENRLFLKRSGKFTIVGDFKMYRCNIGKSVLLMADDSSVIRYDIKKENSLVIYKGKRIKDIALDETAEKIVFVTGDTTDFHIYKYEVGWTSPVEVASNIINNGVAFNYDLNSLTFSKDASSVLFGLIDKRKPVFSQRKSSSTGPVIWASEDRFLHSSDFLRNKNRFQYSISYKSGLVVPLELDTLKLVQFPKSRFALTKSVRNESEAYWKEEENPDYYLISLETGQRLSFAPPGQILSCVNISPNEQYITWVNIKDSCYYIYDISKEKATNITHLLFNNKSVKQSNVKFDYAAATWYDNDRILFIYDQFDIWQIDVNKAKVPICLTSRFGYRNNMTFRIAVDLSKVDADLSKGILLTAIANSSMLNGFSLIPLSRETEPRISMLDSCLYYFPLFSTSDLKFPIFRPSQKLVLVSKQSAELDPNLYLIKDLRFSKKISKVDRPLNYRWFRAELHSWKTDDGLSNKGILYYPVDLDTSKKYPIILNYYMGRSNERFQFRRPDLGTENVNIPWYVSRNYVIFIPDIMASKGNTGPAALRSIVEGVRYLAAMFPWIDGNKMGIQGHSFGGYITNFIATHSNLFAAAQASSGRSDLISSYGGLGFGGRSLQFITENGQFNFGTSPWNDPEMYIRNSTIFTIDSVTTPLLLMHGAHDEAVSFSQAIELFTALRREKKRVWLLEYDGGHTLDHDEAGRDFIIRQQEFFDYYLKGMPKPKWMSTHN